MNAYLNKNAIREYRQRQRAKTLWFRALRTMFLFFAGMFADTAEIRKNTISAMLAVGFTGSAIAFI